MRKRRGPCPRTLISPGTQSCGNGARVMDTVNPSTKLIWGTSSEHALWHVTWDKERCPWKMKYK